MKKSRSKPQQDYTYTYSSDWIHKLESSDHWLLYWNQADLIMKYIQPEEPILEVGVGSGFTANYLKSKSYKVTTLDIDADKKPDIIGNIADHVFKSNYDYLLAFEVFEHIPFEKFKESLNTINSAIHKGIILSLPINTKTWLELTIKTLLVNKSWAIKTKRRKIIAKNHFWELAYKSYTENLIITIFREQGFRLAKIRRHQHIVFFVFLR